MDGSIPPPTGPVDSARALGGDLLALLQVRAELAAIEIREGAERHKRQAALGLAGLLFLAASLLLAAFFVVVFFWDTYRLPAIAGVTGLYTAVGAGLLLRYRKEVRESPPPLSATLGEFRKDLDAWQRREG